MPTEPTASPDSSQPEAAAAEPSRKELSNRVFGLIFAGIFTVIAVYPIVFGSGELRQWAAIIASLFAATALVIPALLTPLNKAWDKFGQFMHKIINPILMGLIFFVTVVPTGLVIKLLGKDPMRRKLDKHAQSYWIERKDSISKEFFDNQF